MIVTNIGYAIAACLTLHQSLMVQLSSAGQMIKSPELFMTLFAAFLGKTNAFERQTKLEGLWITCRDNKFMNLSVVQGTQKLQSAPQSLLHTGRHVGLFTRTQLYMCTQAVTHTHYWTDVSLSHVKKPHD